MELLEEDGVSEGDVTLEDDGMPLLEMKVMLEDGAMTEEGLRVKLAEIFVRKPVDAPVPEG